MKKKNLFYVLLALAVCFISCDNGNEPNPDDGGDKSTEKLVSKIEIERPEYRKETMLFTYNEKNQVSKIVFNTIYLNSEKENDGYGWQWNITYSENKIILIEEDVDLYDECTMNLNKDKSVASIIIEDTQTGEYEYNNNYLKKFIFISESGNADFGWKDNNLTTVQLGKEWGNDIINIEYSEYDNKSNLDLFWILNGDKRIQESIYNPYFGLLGFFGNKSEKLISEVHSNYSGGSTVEYKFDSEGYVTECTENDSKVFKIEYNNN